MIPQMTICTVDVRDLAEAHLKGVLVDEAKGHRFIMVARHPWLKEFADWIHEKHGDKFSKIPREVAPLSDDPEENKKKGLGVQSTSDNSKSQKILGIKYRDVKDSMLDMVASLIESGYIKPE